MTTIPPLESASSRTTIKVDINSVRTAIMKKFSDSYNTDLMMKEIDRFHSIWKQNINKLNEKRSYGVLLDILNEDIEFCHNYHTELWKNDRYSKPTINHFRKSALEWDNYLSKLRRLIIRNFEALNEIREFTMSNSLKSMIKGFKMYFLWFDMTDTQLRLVDKLVAFSRIQLKTAYTCNYIIPPPEQEILKKLQEIEEDFFNRTL